MSQKNIREFIRTVLKEERQQLDSAQVLSQWAHQGQKRRSGEPYFLHPQEVADIVKKYYNDHETYYTAMLHDALEDGIPLGNIEDEESFFNMLTSELPESSISSIDSIYNSVVDLTKQKDVDYIQYVTDLTTNPIAFRVKLADMMQNISDRPSERQLKKYVKTKNTLAERFKNQVPPGISKQHWLDFQKTIDRATQEQ